MAQTLQGLRQPNSESSVNKFGLLSSRLATRNLPVEANREMIEPDRGMVGQQSRPGEQ
jgi:hypothetical protein